MLLETLRAPLLEDFACAACSQIGEQYSHPAGVTLWRCSSCDATHNVADNLTGRPRGVPASPECRALRYQGHALVDCMGTQRAYSLALPMRMKACVQSRSCELPWRSRPPK